MNSLKEMALALFVVLSGAHATAAEEMKVPLVLTGGHDTEAKDSGRPVVLIAAALGVKPDVFRDAFSRVKPAKDGKPAKEEAERNKEMLMKVLKPYGVSSERLDQVSDYYRYKSGKGNVWKATPAKAYAVLENGKVKRIVVTDPTELLDHGLELTRLELVLFGDRLRFRVLA